jgi:hypothetical protein
VMIDYYNADWIYAGAVINWLVVVVALSVTLAAGWLIERLLSNM